MKTLLIGPNNDLSRAIYDELIAKGKEVYKSSRSDVKSEFYFEIEDDLSWKKYRQIDVIIYTAWKMSPRNSSVATKNILAAKTILALNSDKKMIFVSSMSANPFSISEYGKAKYEVEKEYLKLKKNVVKPGILFNLQKNTILGSVGKLMKFMDHLFFLPSINPDFRIFISNVEEVAQRVCDIIEGKDTNDNLAKRISFNLFIVKFLRDKNIRISLQSRYIEKIIDILPSRISIAVNIKDSWYSLKKDSSKTFFDDN
jgi:hypothetical protein